MRKEAYKDIPTKYLGSGTWGKYTLRHYCDYENQNGQALRHSESTLMGLVLWLEKHFPDRFEPQDWDKPNYSASMPIS